MTQKLNIIASCKIVKKKIFKLLAVGFSITSEGRAISCNSIINNFRYNNCRKSKKDRKNPNYGNYDNDYFGPDA